LVVKKGRGKVVEIKNVDRTTAGPR
jgi:hypothetical protein